MEPANEDAVTAPLSQPIPSTPSDSPLHSKGLASISTTDDLVAATLTNGISVTNGAVFPSLSPPSSNETPKARPVSGVVPPYWRRHRGASHTSQTSLPGEPAITLEDHTEDPDSVTSRGLWARSVSVDDHVVVQGKTGIGAYVVWNCRIQTLDV